VFAHFLFSNQPVLTSSGSQGASELAVATCKNLPSKDMPCGPGIRITDQIEIRTAALEM
jgi:hypothetical protein